MLPARSTAARLWIAIEDRLIPALRLTTHERALYYHLVRRTHLAGRRAVRVSRRKLAAVLGLSTYTARQYLRVLARKNCVRFLDRGSTGCLVTVLLPDEIASSLPASFVAGLPACLKEGLSAAILAGSATHACLACPELRRRACPACPERSRREWKRGKQTRRARPERNRKELCRGERCRRDQLASLTHHPPIALDAAGQPRAWPRTDHFRDKAFREKILLRDRGRCFYCRRALGVPSIPSVAEGQDKKSYAEGSYAEGPARPLSVGDWSLDHVVPVARSGSDAISNLVACCHSCNSSKTDLPAEEFLRKLREEMLLSKSQLRSQLNALRLLARKSS